MSLRCICCQRPWDVIRPDDWEPGKPREIDTACRECIRHQGFTMQANTEHLAMWAGDVEAFQLRHDGIAAHLSSQVSALQQELAARPEKIIERVIEPEDVARLRDDLDEVESEAERSFRSRDRAYEALCEIRILHHELDDETCRHGGKFDQCPVGMIVDRYPALRRWEEKQIERLKRGEDHLLPDGHAAVLDRRQGHQA